MNLVQKSRCIIIIIIIIGFLYYILLPINIHYASISFAQNITKMFETADVRKFDFYYQKSSVINIENERKTYSECRDNIKKFGSKVPQGSYGYYDVEPFESPFGKKHMYFHITDGEFKVIFHMKLGVFFKVDEIFFEHDPNGFYNSFFFQR